ncbi:UNVERIFIED_CONTAM: protein IWS11, partial [Sesamum radiatum]
DDQEGFRTLDDDNFMDALMRIQMTVMQIRMTVMWVWMTVMDPDDSDVDPDDSDVDPDDSYGSGNEHSPIYATQKREKRMRRLRSSSMGKDKKKNEKSAAETALLVENVMAELKVVAEEDAELYRQGKPATNKLEKLSLLTDVLSKKQLHQEFLDHGGLTLLKNWLEPLPDGNLPDINIRTAVLKFLNDFPIDLQHSDRRGLLKRSGLGKSQPIYDDNITRLEDLKNVEDERIDRRPPDKKVTGKGTTMASRDDDLD